MSAYRVPAPVPDVDPPLFGCMCSECRMSRNVVAYMSSVRQMPPKSRGLAARIAAWWRTPRLTRGEGE